MITRGHLWKTKEDHPRMPVTRTLRYQILRRDNHTCRYCGRSAPQVALEVDHVIPEALGGTDDPTNLITACDDCNGGKAATPPDAPLVADVHEAARNWAAAMLTAREMHHEDRAQRDRQRAAFHTAWNRWTYPGPDRSRLAFDLPLGWPETIDRFIAAGLDESDLADLIDQTMRTPNIRDQFRYLCGLAWALLHRRQETARTLLQQPDKPASVEVVGYYLDLTCPECGASPLHVEISGTLGEPYDDDGERGIEIDITSAHVWNPKP